MSVQVAERTSSPIFDDKPLPRFVQIWERPSAATVASVYASLTADRSAEINHWRDRPRCRCIGRDRSPPTQIDQSLTICSSLRVQQPLGRPVSPWEPPSTAHHTVLFRLRREMDPMQYQFWLHRKPGQATPIGSGRDRFMSMAVLKLCGFHGTTPCYNPDNPFKCFSSFSKRGCRVANYRTNFRRIRGIPSRFRFTQFPILRIVT